jgi:hypothetical protein
MNRTHTFLTVGEEELSGLDTKPLVGHLAA